MQKNLQEFQQLQKMITTQRDKQIKLRQNRRTNNDSVQQYRSIRANAKVWQQNFKESKDKRLNRLQLVKEISDSFDKILKGLRREVNQRKKNPHKTLSGSEAAIPLRKIVDKLRQFERKFNTLTDYDIEMVLLLMKKQFKLNTINYLLDHNYRLQMLGRLPLRALNKIKIQADRQRLMNWNLYHVAQKGQVPQE